MKEIRITKMVEQTTVKFIANDGKEFIGENAERECLNYEKRLNEKQCEKDFKKICIKSLNPPLVQWYYGDEIRFDIVRLENETDIDTVKNYYTVIGKDMWDFDDMVKSIAIPSTQIFTCGYEFVALLNKTIDEVKKEFIEFTSMLPMED